MATPFQPVGKEAFAKGSSGEVWLYGNGSEYVAGKVVWGSVTKYSNWAEREKEALEIIEKIGAPGLGLVKIKGVEKHSEGDLVYLMELADDMTCGRSINPLNYQAKTLGAVIGTDGMPVEDCLTTLETVSAGLIQLHDAGLVHRDIKPSNIIFVDGLAKLADYGLVTDPLLTQNKNVGTKGYIPPEGFEDVRSDIFSLGKLLYVMATGNSADPKSPHPTSSDPCRKWPGLPRNLSTLTKRDRRLKDVIKVFNKACHPDPRRRYQTVRDVQADLQRIKKGKSVRSRTWERPMKRWLPTSALITSCMLIMVSRPTDSRMSIAEAHFDSGSNALEGWQGVNNRGGDETLELIMNEPGPGGYLRISEETGDGTTMYFKAATAFVGDKSAAYGGTLSFKLRQRHKDQFSVQDDIILEGGGTRLAHRLGRTPTASWQQFDVGLYETAGWTVLPTEQPATRADLKAVLSRLENLFIRGEFSTRTKEETDLDDVIMMGPPMRWALFRWGSD